MMKNVIKTLSLGLLLSAPFMQGMEERPLGLGLMDMQDEILLPIFSQLGAIQDPVEFTNSLLQLRMTCKRFNSLLSDEGKELEKLLTPINWILKSLFLRVMESNFNSKNIRTIAILLKSKMVDIKAIQWNLHVGATKKNCPGKVAELLLTHGANPNKILGWPPLMYAISSENLEFTKTLLKHGADPNFNNSELTPFELTPFELTRGRLEFVEQLIVHGLDCSKINFHENWSCPSNLVTATATGTIMLLLALILFYTEITITVNGDFL